MIHRRCDLSLLGVAIELCSHGVLHDSMLIWEGCPKVLALGVYWCSGVLLRIFASISAAIASSYCIIVVAI